MRVLLYSATPRSDAGGVQIVMEDLHRGFVERGVSVLRAGPDEPSAEGHVRLHLEAGAGASGRPSAAALPRAAASLTRLAGLLATFRPDIVNVHFVTGAVAYFLALRPVFRFRLVVSPHGGDLRRPPATIQPHLGRLLRSADAVTVVSRDLAATARRCADLECARLAVIPNGIDANFWSPDAGYEPEPGRIQAAGRLQEVKGFDLLILALHGLPEARLTIFGEGPERRALTGLAGRIGVMDRLDLPGRVSPEDLRAALRQATVFALPSRSEGMPLALIEALACGCPAVAARVGGVAEVVTPGSGVLVEPENVDALRDGLHRILSGQASVSRAKARERGTAFSSARTIGRYLELFRRLSDRGERLSA